MHDGADVLICRPGFEREVAAEWLQLRHGKPDGLPLQSGSGWVLIPNAKTPLPAPLIFERQRLPHAHWCADADSTVLAAHLVESAAEGLAAASAWTLHSFATNPDAEGSFFREAVALKRRVLARLEQEYPAALGNFHPCEEAPADPTQTVWQLCRVGEGVWSSLSPASALSDPYPGGVHRMPGDPLAPSRSYLKIEEALDVMRRAGLCDSPRPTEAVVDLGAAPGGWTWAFLKRGCRVYAVDNGTLKLRSHGEMGGEVIHLRQDGMRFRPHNYARAPVDWLLSDMLIAPGQALGLLRRWLDGGWARRLVVNIKLPQQYPLAALTPICAYLREVPGLRFQMRQLYHDRREVTVMGEVEMGQGAQHRKSTRRRGGKT
jgi:23S rRNA C2498 (ribose-2'-O)-methylase RlmM